MAKTVKHTAQFGIEQEGKKEVEDGSYRCLDKFGYLTAGNIRDKGH